MLIKAKLKALYEQLKSNGKKCYQWILTGFETLRKINYKSEIKNYIQSKPLERYLKQIRETYFNLMGHDKMLNLVEKINFKIMSTAGTVVLIFFVAIAALGSNLNFGYRIVCNGKTVGISLTRAEAKEAFFSAKEELVKIKGSENTEIGTVKMIFTVANKELFQSNEFLQNAIVACYDGRQDGYGIFVDGSLIVALSCNEDAARALEKYKEEYAKGSTDNISFNKKVEIQPVRVATSYIKPVEDAIQSLKIPKEGITKHIVSEGETISAIAIKYNTSSKKLMDLNPTIKPETMQIGQALLVSDTTPILAVKTTEQIVENERMSYSTNQVEDGTSYKGVTLVVKEGQEGEKEVIYDVVKENGVVVSKVAVAETVLKQPVSKEVKVGTKQRPSKAPTGSFSMPYYGVLTSRYGSRSRGFHTGIDLAGHVGDSVYASDGGTVTSAGWNGSYGKMIKIQHDNGYETYYAHLSSVNVSVGQKVAKKEFIGKLGNTGNSTGPHLHFEIRKNGTVLNPSSYLR